MNNTELRTLLKETVKCLKIICGGIEPKTDVIRSVEECVDDIEQTIEHLKFEINAEYGNIHKPIVVDAFPATVFSTFKDEDDTWYTIRAEYIEETETGYVYKLGRRPTMTGFASDAVEQFIMVKLSRRPETKDLKEIWTKVVKK